MDTQDGFIVGVYHYCDRWCEYCPLTGRCRVFATGQEIDFEVSSGKSIEQAVDGLRARIRALMPPVELDPEDEDIVEDGVLEAGAEAPRQHGDVEQRAREYGLRVWTFLEGRSRPEVHRPGVPDPLDVVGHFSLFVASKTFRALCGLSMEVDERYDANGSAKAALLGIERSHAAWLDLVQQGGVAEPDSAPFIADLIWLGDALTRIFPAARAFVRPGLDEPDAVAQLEAREP